MNRLDLHSVATTLQKHLIENADLTQILFISTLFSCFVDESDFSFDEGLCCKWIKGQAKISPKIISYYQLPKHHKEMYADMEEEVFLLISDVGALVKDLYELAISDTSISELKKTELLSFFHDSDIEKAAVFVSELLLFAMSRPFVKTNAKADDTSPLIEDIIITTSIPKPVKSYLDRVSVMTDLNTLMDTNNTLFLHGIPGVGKSELAKAYCKAHKKDYTNILYLEYSGSLYEMIVDLDFVDDTDSLTEKERFKRHLRFLKTLKEDSLIVIDNFSQTSAPDSLLSTFCSLKCKKLFTTQNTITGYPCYELISDPDFAKELFQFHCADHTLYTDNELAALLETVHYHTVTVELTARLLSYQTHTAEYLLNCLQKNVLLKDDDCNITLTKDNRNRKFVYHKHVENLLDLQQLNSETLTVLSVIALAPATGFPAKLFYSWHGPHINALQELTELGLLMNDNQRLVLNPYIRKIINARKLLYLSQVPDFFETLKTILSDCYHEHIRLALDILNTSTFFLNKDDRLLWKKLVMHGLECSSHIKQYRIFQNLLGEFEGICYLDTDITNEDRATLFHYMATKSACLNQNIVKALEWEEKAIDEACREGTMRIYNLSSMYLDAGNYCSKLMKPKQALTYVQKSSDLLVLLKMQYSFNGLFTMTTYAKLLHQQGNFVDAARIFSTCISITDKVFKTDTITKGYLLQNLAAVHASVGNNKTALMHYAQAEGILSKFLDTGHPDLLICKEQRNNVVTLEGQKVTLLEEKSA